MLRFTFIYLLQITFIGSFLFVVSCKGDIVDIPPGNDPNFTIISHSDQGFSSTNRKVSVFGVDIYAVSEVNDEKLLHAANVLAQYLDNNEDGNVDNNQVHDKMIENKAFVIMWKDDNDLDIEPPNDRIGQDLGDDETNPNFVINNKLLFSIILFVSLFFEPVIFKPFFLVFLVSGFHSFLSKFIRKRKINFE